MVIMTFIQSKGSVTNCPIISDLEGKRVAGVERPRELDVIHLMPCDVARFRDCNGILLRLWGLDLDVWIYVKVVGVEDNPVCCDNP